MVAPQRNYWTLDGLPPNGGLPPTMGAYPASAPEQPPPPPPYAPPGTAPPATPGFNWGVNFAIGLGYPRTSRSTPAPTPAPLPFAILPTIAPAPAPTPPAAHYAPPSVPPVHQPQPTAPPGSQINGTNLLTSNGQGYIAPPVPHTTLHLFAPGTTPWTLPPTSCPRFMSVFVPTTLTIRELIWQLHGAQGIDANAGIAEVLECGNGVWRRGSSWFWGEPGERCLKTLAEVGWGGEMGVTVKPVWVTAFKG